MTLAGHHWSSENLAASIKERRVRYDRVYTCGTLKFWNSGRDQPSTTFWLL